MEHPAKSTTIGVAVGPKAKVKTVLTTKSGAVPHMAIASIIALVAMVAVQGVHYIQLKPFIAIDTQVVTGGVSTLAPFDTSLAPCVEARLCEGFSPTQKKHPDSAIRDCLAWRIFCVVIGFPLMLTSSAGARRRFTPRCCYSTLFLVLQWGAWSVPSTEAATTNVSPGNGTLQAAMDAASAGDTLVLADGTYTGGGDQVLHINSRITIRAQNAGNAILDGENLRRVIWITAGQVSLHGLRITKGYALPALEGGAGVFVALSKWSADFVNLTSCKIISNVCDPTDGVVSIGRGGGVYAIGGNVILRNNFFADNDAKTGGCHLDIGPEVKETYSELFNNTFSTSGGIRTTINRCVSTTRISIMAVNDMGHIWKCTKKGYWMPPAPFVTSNPFLVDCDRTCDPGYYGNTYTERSGTCSGRCPAGHYCPGATVAPKMCAIGSYSESDGATACLPCPALSTTTSTNSTSIAECKCSPGYFFASERDDRKFCRPCGDKLPFSTTPIAGATSANDCVCLLGFFADTRNGTRSCVPCESHMDCSFTGVTLANVPIQMGVWRLGSNTGTFYKCFNVLACVGNPGSFTSPPPPPPFPGYNDDIPPSPPIFPYPPPNYLGDRRMLLATVNSTVNSTFNSTYIPWYTLTAGDALCAPGHTGFLCGTCTEGYHGYSDRTLCQECSSSSATNYLPLVILAAVAIITVIFRCTKTGAILKPETLKKLTNGSIVEELAKDEEQQVGKRKGTATLKRFLVLQAAKAKQFHTKFSNKAKILISLYQVVGGMEVVYAIPFPPVYSSVVSTVSGIIQIELPSLVPLDCIVRTSFYSRLVFKCIWPLVVYAALGLLASITYTKEKKKGNEKSSIADSAMSWIFFLMFILYPSISTSLFSMFYCEPLEDGTSWLRVDLSLECSTSTHAGMMAFTYLMLLIHVIGTPAIYCYLLFWKHYAALEALKKQEMRSKHWQALLQGPATYTNDQSGSLAQTSPWPAYTPSASNQSLHTFVTNDQSVADHTSPSAKVLNAKDLLPDYVIRLTGGYGCHAYWFELFETLRKVLLVGVPSSFPERGGLAQLFVGLLVCFATFGFYMMFSPFPDERDDLFSQLAQTQIFVTLLSSLALRAIPPSKLVGDMITVILFLVPISGIFLETTLVDELSTLWVKVKKKLEMNPFYLKCFSNCQRPALQGTSAQGSEVHATKVPLGVSPAQVLPPSSH